MHTLAVHLVQNVSPTVVKRSRSRPRKSVGLQHGTPASPNCKRHAMPRATPTDALAKMLTLTIMVVYNALLIELQAWGPPLHNNNYTPS